MLSLKVSKVDLEVALASSDSCLHIHVLDNIDILSSSTRLVAEPGWKTYPDSVRRHWKIPSKLIDPLGEHGTPIEDLIYFMDNHLPEPLDFMYLVVSNRYPHTQIRIGSFGDPLEPPRIWEYQYEGGQSFDTWGELDELGNYY